MLDPKDLFDIFLANNIDYFSGVPDSTLKHFCFYLEDHAPHHTICVNEGAAIAQGIGYHLATNKTPLIYMQNSGFSNALNPILSMASKEIYQIPMIILVGWRGEPGVSDEPQHLHQGKVLLASLKAMELDHACLPQDIDKAQEIVSQALENVKKNHAPFFLIVKRNTFKKYTPKISKKIVRGLERPKVIEMIIDHFPNAKFMATTGFTSRELFQLREEKNMGHQQDFLNIGAMGYVSQMAYSYAQYSNHKTICFDGDGSFLMHMGGLNSIQSFQKTDIIHIVFNNGQHLSVGGQETNMENIDLSKIAQSCGFSTCYSLSTYEELEKVLLKKDEVKGPLFIEIKVSSHTLKELMRPTLSTLQMKKDFME